MAANRSYLNNEEELNNKFIQLQEKGKDLARDGKISEAIELFKEAYKINPTKKVKKRIEKLQIFLEEYGENINEDMVEIDDKFYLYHELYNKLYPYQRDGVKWLWNLYNKKKGGILGDDMGLGKTIQIIAFLSGMFDMEEIKHVLIIMPVSLLPNWDKEFKKWVPGLTVNSFHNSNKRERERQLIKTQRHGGVLLTSYGMIVTNCEILSNRDEKEFVWDYVILDEGHKIKNPTKTTKAVHAIPARNRIVLTGTPIQNNLKELWALYDFVQQGTLLGSLQTFKTQYEIPITRSREKDATSGERKLGERIAASLRSLINPYFLRRTKEQVLSERKNENQYSDSLSDNLNKVFCLSRKNDFIIWLYLSPKQLKIYKDFLELDRVKNILMTKRSPLVELTVLKKICDHPRLLSKKACIQLGLDGDVSLHDIDDDNDDDDQCSTVSIENVSDEVLIEESGKLTILLSLLQNLKESDHRTLIFSQSRKMLDIIQRILINKHWKVLRIDGTITKVEERHRRIQCFQNDSTISVFLLTTQVGGVGLTLTGADRVIIYDPSWNPATDAQAVDRVYRIGQNKSVVVYRLITCSTVEEKIYRRQIFKDSINRQTTGGNKDPHRYFTKQELRELFILENPYHSTTQVQLEEMHANQRNSDTNLDNHIAFLYNLPIFGISDHDLMFSGNFAENNDDEQVPEEYINQRVEKAQMLLQIESAQTLEDIEKTKTFARPFTVPVINSKKTSSIDNYNAPSFPDQLDLLEVNTSMQNMSIQEKSFDIADTSVVAISKTENLLDNKKAISNLVSSSNINLLKIEDTETNSKTGIQSQASSRNYIFVPDSDNSKSISPKCNLSTELFIPESDDESQINTNIDYRNKSINNFQCSSLKDMRDNQNHIQYLQKPVQQQKNNPNDKSKSINKDPSIINISSDSEVESFSYSHNVTTSSNVLTMSDGHKHICEDDAFYENQDKVLLPTVTEKSLCRDMKTNVEPSEHHSLKNSSLVNDETMDINKYDSGKENHMFINIFQTSIKNQSPIKRITPLKISHVLNSVENNPFQKALKESVERYPITSSPVISNKPKKFEVSKQIPLSFQKLDTINNTVENISMVSACDENNSSSELEDSIDSQLLENSTSIMDDYEKSSDESAIIRSCKKRVTAISDDSD